MIKFKRKFLNNRHKLCFFASDSMASSIHDHTHLPRKGNTIEEAICSKQIALFWTDKKCLLVCIQDVLYIGKLDIG